MSSSSHPTEDKKEKQEHIQKTSKAVCRLERSMKTVQLAAGIKNLKKLRMQKKKTATEI